MFNFLPATDDYKGFCELDIFLSPRLKKFLKYLLDFIVLKNSFQSVPQYLHIKPNLNLSLIDLHIKTNTCSAHSRVPS